MRSSNLQNSVCQIAEAYLDARRMSRVDLRNILPEIPREILLTLTLTGSFRANAIIYNINDSDLLSGEEPAAMQHANGTRFMSSPLTMVVFFIVFALIKPFQR